MDDSEVQRLVRELDAQVSKEDAKLLVYAEDDDGTCELIGNRKGYLRAAIEMLRASATPLSPGDSITSVDFSYLGSDRSLIVKRLTRSEDIESAASSHSDLVETDRLRDRLSRDCCLPGDLRHNGVHGCGQLVLQEVVAWQLSL